MLHRLLTLVVNLITWTASLTLLLCASICHAHQVEEDHMPLHPKLHLQVPYPPDAQQLLHDLEVLRH